MLDTQCSPKTPNNKEGFEHAQSCVLIIELPSDQQSNGHTQKRLAMFNHIAGVVAFISGPDLQVVQTLWKSGPLCEVCVMCVQPVVYSTSSTLNHCSILIYSLSI